MDVRATRALAIGVMVLVLATTLVPVPAQAQVPASQDCSGTAFGFASGVQSTALTGGCAVWASTVAGTAGGAGAFSPDGRTLFAVGASSTALRVIATDVPTGVVLWVRSVAAASGPPLRTDIEVHPDGGTVFVLARGIGLFSFRAGDGALVWGQGSTLLGVELALSHDGTRLYEPGPLLSVAAYDTATGARVWTASTTAWVPPGRSTGACSGTAPSRVAIAPDDSLVYVARGATCSSLPLATAAFAATGQLAWVSTPSPGIDASGPGSWTGVDIAADPSGTRVGVVGNYVGPYRAAVLVTYDAVTGQPLWSRSLISCARLTQSACSIDTAVAVAASADGASFVVAGLNFRTSMSWDTSVAMFDAWDGRTLGAAGSFGEIASSAPAAWLEVGPSGATAFVAFGPVDGRYNVHELATPSLGVVWSTSVRSGQAPSVLASVAASPTGDVVAVSASTSGNWVLKALTTGVAGETLAAAGVGDLAAGGRADPLIHWAGQTAVSGPVGGIESYPLVVADAGRKTEVWINVTDEASLFSVLVRNVPAPAEYALAAVGGTGSLVASTGGVDGGCHGSGTTVCAPGADRDPGACAEPTCTAPRIVAVNEPTRTDDTDALGTVLFGPIPLTEGRYHVVRTDQALELECDDVGCAPGLMECVASAGVSALVGCIQVHVRVTVPPGTPLPSAPVPEDPASQLTEIKVPLGWSGTREQPARRSCQAGHYKWAIPGRVAEEAAWTGSMPEPILFSAWSYAHVERTYFADCREPETFVYPEAASVAFLAAGATELRNGDRWGFTTYGGTADHNMIHLKAPAIFVPDTPQQQVPRLTVGLPEMVSFTKTKGNAEKVLDGIALSSACRLAGRVERFGWLAQLACGTAQSTYYLFETDSTRRLDGVVHTGGQKQGYPCGNGCFKWNLETSGDSRMYAFQGQMRPYGDGCLALPIEATFLDGMIYYGYRHDGEDPREATVDEAGHTPIRVMGRVVHASVGLDPAGTCEEDSHN